MKFINRFKNNKIKSKTITKNPTKALNLRKKVDEDIKPVSAYEKSLKKL